MFSLPGTTLSWCFPIPDHALENHPGINLPSVAHSEFPICILQAVPPGGLAHREPCLPTTPLPRETSCSENSPGSSEDVQEELAQASWIPLCPGSPPSSCAFWNPPNHAAPNAAWDSPFGRPARPPHAMETAWGRERTGGREAPCGHHSSSRLTTFQFPLGGVLTSPASRLPGDTHQPSLNTASHWIAGESQGKAPLALGRSGQ